MPPVTSPSSSPRAATFVVVALGLSLVAFALGTFDYMLEAMRLDLGFSPEDANAALVIPEIGCLMVVFLAGTLGDAMGRRRVLIAGGLAFALGGAMVALAPTLAWVVTGRVLEGVGGALAAIVALAVLSDAYPSGRARAIAFGASAAIVPAVWVVAPLLGAWVTREGNWRIGAAAWVLAGVATAAAARLLMHRDGPPRRAELVTPALAGVVLAAVVAAVTSNVLGGRALLIGAGITALVALAALAVAMRVVRSPGLDLRIPRTGRGALAMLAIVAANTVNLFFFTSLLLQYRYDFDPLAVALILVPLQFAGVVGGLAGGPLMARLGVIPAGALLLAAGAATSLLALLVAPASSPWLVVLTICAFAATDAATTGPMTARVMDLAPRDGEGGAAAHREAAASLGGAVGAVLAGLLIFGGYQSTLQGKLEGRGVTPPVAAEVAAKVTDGAEAAEVARAIDAPPPGIRELMGDDPPALSTSQVSAYHDAALVSAVTYGAAALLFAASGGRPSRRRRRDGGEVIPRERGKCP